MAASNIKNVVFDIGNVIVRWDPALIMTRSLGEDRGNADLTQSFFLHDLWFQLNRGEISWNNAKTSFLSLFDLDKDDIEAIFFHITDSQDLNTQTVEMMERLSKANFRLFALSDNVHHIVEYLKTKYEFWDYFDGAVISAEIGSTKPSGEIFAHLLSTHNLQPEETVFLDDVQKNIDGAKAAGIHAFQFTSVQKAEQDLMDLGLKF